MRLMIDTNIALDVLIRRGEFYDHSRAVLKLCEDKIVTGFVSASSVTDIFYLTRRALGDLNVTYQVVGALLGIVKILSVTDEDVKNAFMMKAKDFEDCLMAVCAKSNLCDAIVTRNEKDFAGFGIVLYTPEELLNYVAGASV